MKSTLNSLRNWPERIELHPFFSIKHIIAHEKHIFKKVIDKAGCMPVNVMGFYPTLFKALVVKAYFEKDFVEKVFRTLKTSEEMEPVRHRLERRVRVYIFVCVLAYRLLADLQWRLQKIGDHKDVWKEADAFLYDLERVERVQVRLGHQVKTWHLNLTGKSQKTLEMMGFKDLLKDTIEGYY